MTSRSSMSFEILVIFGALLVAAGCVLGDNNRCGFDSSGSCESNQVCCNHQCVYDSDCGGRTCSDFYSDPCSGMPCCDGNCQYYCDDYTVPIIIGIVAGVCFFVCILTVIIYCICRKRQRNPSGGYIITQSQGQQIYAATPAAHFNQVTTYSTGQPYGQQGYVANPPYGYGAI